MPTPPETDGFTLLELMVVVALIALFVGISYPEFSRWTEKQRLAGDARQLHGLMQSARSQAIETGTSVVVRFGKGRGETGTFMAFFDPNGNATQDSGETTLAAGHVSASTELLSASFDPNATGTLSATHTTFDGMGLATGHNGQVILGDRHSRTATLTLGPSGSTSVCAGS